MRWLCVGLMMLIFPLTGRAEELTVSAAISLKESLTQIGQAYEKSTGDHLTFNFDASGKLGAQIKQGAPVDVFISADNEQMDKLDKLSKLVTNTRRTVVRNDLVLIAPANETDPPKNFADLTSHADKKIAIGEPKTVPAGRYAMQTLKALKLDQSLAPRLVLGESVRQVLTYVENGNVCAGIVYSTDAKQAGDKVKLIAIAEASTHDSIEYPAAVIASTAHAKTARDFLDYLASQPARDVFVQKGFVLPDAPSTRASP